MIDDKVVTTKGKVCCELTVGDELVITELLFGNMFENLKIEVINALLSCFMFDEKVKETVVTELSDELRDVYLQLRNKIKEIIQISQESKIENDYSAYINSFSPGLMNVVYAWTQVFILHFFFNILQNIIKPHKYFFCIFFKKCFDIF